MTVRERLFALEQFGIKLGLDQIRALLSRLGHPERSYPSLTIAGTNGKGSVTAFVERGLRAAGYRTGRYTSPHLVSLEERFALGGEPISPDVCDRIASRVMDAAATLAVPPTFFEATTALALDLFREARVDVAVLEVGLGGRLDATTAVDPIAAAITLIDFDHEQQLGHTLPAIAAEKAGIIKPGGLVVLSENPPEAATVIAERAREVGATLVAANDGTTAGVTMADGHARVRLVTPWADYGERILGLRGRHQVQNAVTAVRLLEEVTRRGPLNVPASAIVTALERASWPGRLELLRRGAVDVLLDGAHNPSGARALASYVLDTYDRPLPMVIGLMKDKAADAIIESLAPAASHFVLTAASNARAASPADLAGAAARVAPGVPRDSTPRPVDAIALAAAAGSPVVVAGSLYLVGEVRAELS